MSEFPTKQAGVILARTRISSVALESDHEKVNYCVIKRQDELKFQRGSLAKMSPFNVKRMLKPQ